MMDWPQTHESTIKPHDRATGSRGESADALPAVLPWVVKAARRLLRPALLLALLVAAPVMSAQEISLDDEPRRYLIIHVEGARGDWQVRPIKVTDRNGLDLQGARSGDFRTVVERWERTGLPKRYDVSLWKQAAETHLGANARPGARFHFYAIHPRQPRAEGKLNLIDQQRRIYWVPAESVTVKGYPQTWVDLFEGYVDQFRGEERQEAVKRWEQAHRDVIRNDENSELGFTQEERNEFARFYQRQFVYIRDNNPKLASIYDELAAFHRERGNLDAELSTYLAALRAGVESPDRERFALAVGRIFVNRLNLYREAVPHLQEARNHTEAVYLLARCHFETGDYARAGEELNGLVAVLADPGEEVVLEGDADEETGRARLMLAEIDFKRRDFAALAATVGGIPQDNPHWDAARVLYCAMLIQRDLPRTRDRRSDAELARELIREVGFWAEAVAHTQPGDGHVYPLDPLMARALLIYAQGDRQFTERQDGRNPPKPSEEVMRFLNAARALNPLSAEPHYAEGRLLVHLGRFSEAHAAFQAGLDVNPTHVLLNFAVADLYLKAGMSALAKEHLETCLKYDADFFPAHVMLGEIATREFERLREQLLIRRAAGDDVDYAGELVPLMKEAAAFFSSALAINPEQPATELALATLYLRLSEVAPLTIADRVKGEAVRRAYLVKARDMAFKLIEEIEELAKQDRSERMTERELARMPSLAAFNVYAFALYTLGEHGEALEWFNRHIERASSRRYIPDSATRHEYEGSAALAYAREWVVRIERNRRQYYEIDEFDVDSEEDFWGNWVIPQKLKPDLNFRDEVRITGGRAVFDVKQQDTGVVSRFETRKPHQTLAKFEAEFVEVGDIYLDRGIHLTKAQASSAAEPNARFGVMLGISEDGDVFWETREYKTEDTANAETVAQRGIIEPESYGGVPLQPKDRLTLSLRRQLSEDKSAVEYVAIVNGYEITLPVDLKGLTRNDLNTDSWVVMAGFFASGLGGAEGRFEVDRVRFVYDSGLGDER